MGIYVCDFDETYPCMPLSIFFEISFIVMDDFLFQYFCIKLAVTYDSLFHKISMSGSSLYTCEKLYAHAIFILHITF